MTIYYLLENWENIDINDIELKNINWNNISQYQTLSEEFIEKFQNKVDWYWISHYQILSEEFIEKFQDKVDWWNISYSQTLSEEFIEKFQHKVNWYHLSYNQNISIFLKKGYYINKYSFLAKYLKFRKDYILITNNMYRIDII